MQTLHYVNPANRGYHSHRYILCFGAYGWTHIMVDADHLQDALDACVDYIADHFPGLLCDDEVTEAFNDAIAKGMTEDQAHDEALIDVTTAGNCGHYLNSWEWNLVAEDPPRATVKAYEKIEVVR